MTLLTEDERTRLLDNSAAKARGECLDPLPVVKLFTPDARAVWLLTELDPADGDTAYGLSDAGIGWPELGTISISYLECMRGPKGMAVARDPHFKAARTLSKYVHEAEIDHVVKD